MDEHDRTRVLGIDPSTNALAFTLVEDGRPVIWGKMVFYRKADITGKLFMIKPMLDFMLEQTGEPTLVTIEQMISVQNPQTTRVLTYVSGAIMYELTRQGYDVVDVPPMTWKSYMGYMRVTKKLIQQTGMTTKEANALRKSQTQDKLKATFDYFDAKDSDVADSCGIALWGAKISLKGV